MRKSRNGPVITRKFIDAEHKQMFDSGKMTLEEATVVVVAAPFLKPLSTYEVKKGLEIVKHYVYPEFFHAEAKVFILVINDTGEALEKRYMYTEDLTRFVGCSKYSVYVSNTTLS